ncbi:hypothetical protein [Chthonobacter rhizosphaerae]|uniref:hypothetical protein n=1 Tax=Chthonobacter rhizosphaerae TaxID=2735553 RepID=UPI0015EFC11A|nr:hypothetical protein [Chthonobacter rhizosphaerae]
MSVFSMLRRVRGLIGRSASVAVTTAVLAGCATANQVPELCATPQAAQRDPKCAEPVKAQKPVASARTSAAFAVGSGRDSGSDY